MDTARHLAMRATHGESGRPSRPLARMWGGSSRRTCSWRRGRGDERRLRHLRRLRAPWWNGLVMAMMTGWLIVLAACGPTQLANPPAKTLYIKVSVFDHETADHTPSDRTLLYITLERQKPNDLFLDPIEGTDARTLECNGVVMQFVNQLGSGSDSYSGSVPPQTDHYTCTYFWNQGAQQATLTIPVMIPNLPHIQSPASRATLQVPVAGEQGITLTYAPSGNSGASVTATASDFDKRAASSDQQGDSGTAVIAPQRFPSTFSVGWGTLLLTRSLASTDVSNVGTNSTFTHVDLDSYEQVDQIPVFWI